MEPPPQSSLVRSICSRSRLFAEVIGQLTLRDAVQVVMSCRRVAEAVRAGNFEAAIAFAASRPGARSPEDLRSEGCPALSLWKWRSLWESCAHSVAACGLDPSLLACSERIFAKRSDDYCSVEEEGWYKHRDHNGFFPELFKCAQDGTDAVKLVSPRSSLANVDIVAILMIDACLVYDRGEGGECGTLSGLALLLLSDYRFSLVLWDALEQGHTDNTTTGGAVVYVEETLPALFDLVSSKSDENCSWKLDDDGFLTLADWIAGINFQDKVRMAGACKFGEASWHRFNTWLPVNETQEFHGNAWTRDDADRAEQLEKILNACWTGIVPAGLADAQRLGQLSEVTEEPVIQVCTHEEPPASRDVELLQEQEDQEWAQNVEGHIRGGAVASVSVQLAQPSGKVCLLSFRSGKGELFRKMLLQDKEFRHVREALKDAGYSCVFGPSETIVLVRPEQYLQTIAALPPKAVKRYNIVIAESEEYLINEVLLRLCSKQRPREHRAERVELDLLGFITKFKVKRTFLCEVRFLSSARSVAQSTTEAVEADVGPISAGGYFARFRGRNPRRQAGGFLQ